MSTLKVDTITTISGTGNINLSRPIAGDGSNLTGISPSKAAVEALGIELPAANLTGTVADARFPVTLPASSGVNLTALNASNITSGTLPAGRYTDTVYTHPTTAGNKHIPSGGATDQVLTYSSSGTASWADPAAGGKLLRVLASTSPFSATLVSTTNNTWTDSTVAYTFTPLSSSSKFLIWFGMPVTKYDSSGDGGYGFRVKKSQSATTTYPVPLSSYAGANVHSSFYMNPGFTNTIFEYRTWMGFDDTAQNGTSMTYTIQAAHYNLNYMNVGYTYNSIPRIIIQEIGA